jgi:hypothetical protein
METTIFSRVVRCNKFVPYHAVAYVTTPVYFIFLKMLVSPVKSIFSSRALLQGC